MKMPGVLELQFRRPAGTVLAVLVVGQLGRADRSPPAWPRRWVRQSPEREVAGDEAYTTRGQAERAGEPGPRSTARPRSHAHDQGRPPPNSTDRAQHLDHGVDVAACCDPTAPHGDGARAVPEAGSAHGSEGRSGDIGPQCRTGPERHPRVTRGPWPPHGRRPTSPPPTSAPLRRASAPGLGPVGLRHLPGRLLALGRAGQRCGVGRRPGPGPWLGHRAATGTSARTRTTAMATTPTSSTAAWPRSPPPFLGLASSHSSLLLLERAGRARPMSAGKEAVPDPAVRRRRRRRGPGPPRPPSPRHPGSSPARPWRRGPGRRSRAPACGSSVPAEVDHRRSRRRGRP